MKVYIFLAKEAAVFLQNRSPTSWLTLLSSSPLELPLPLPFSRIFWFPLGCYLHYLIPGLQTPPAIRFCSPRNRLFLLRYVLNHNTVGLTASIRRFMRHSSGCRLYVDLVIEAMHPFCLTSTKVGDCGK